MHPGSGEAFESSVGLVRVVHRSGHDDGRRAVLEQVDLLRQALVTKGRGEEVVDRPGDAVALRLAGDHDCVEGEELLEQRRVLLPELLAVGPARDLGPEHRVVLGQRRASLRLEVRL